MDEDSALQSEAIAAAVRDVSGRRWLREVGSNRVRCLALGTPGATGQESVVTHPLVAKAVASLLSYPTSTTWLYTACIIVQVRLDSAMERSSLKAT